MSGFPMQFNVLLHTASGYQTQAVNITTKNYEVHLPGDISNPQNIIINSNGLGYGLFIPEHQMITLTLPDELAVDDLARASYYINLHELFLNHFIDTDAYFRYLANAITCENDSQIRNYLLGNLETVWWQFLNHTNRIILSHTLEETLMGVFNNHDLPADERKPALLTYCRTSISDEALNSLKKTWAKKVI